MQPSRDPSLETERPGMCSGVCSGKYQISNWFNVFGAVEDRGDMWGTFLCETQKLLRSGSGSIQGLRMEMSQMRH